MFKLVVLFALVALAAAAPSPGFIGAHAVPVVHSAVIGSIPTSISHQSQSVVHSAAVVSPVVHAAPYIHSAPLIHHGAVAVHAAPLPIAHHGFGIHGIHHGLVLH